MDFTRDTIFTLSGNKSIFDSGARLHRICASSALCFINNDSDINEVHDEEKRGGKKSPRRETRASQIGRNGCLSFQLEGRNEGKEKRDL